MTVSREDFEKSKQTIIEYYAQDFKAVNGAERPCICCEEKIKPHYPEHTRFPEQGSYSGGTVDKISIGYGSIYDTDQYVIALCDKCLTRLKEENKIEYVGNYMHHF